MTAALTNKDLDLPRVWQVSCFYVGTPDAAAPTALDSDLSDDYTGLGYLSEAGIVESPGQTISDLPVYEGNIARSIITAGGFTLAAELTQTMKSVLETIYNQAAGTDKSIIVDPVRGVPKLPWVLDLEDEDERKRIYAPSAQGRRNGDSTYVKTAITGYPLIVVSFAHPSLAYGTAGAQGNVKIWDSSLT